MVFLFFKSTSESKLSSWLFKNKNPLTGACFLLDCGAGGSRTRVQARRPYAFYMLILP